MSAHYAAVNLWCQTENKQFTSVFIQESAADSTGFSVVFIDLFY